MLQLLVVLCVWGGGRSFGLHDVLPALGKGGLCCAFIGMLYGDANIEKHVEQNRLVCRCSLKQPRSDKLQVSRLDIPKASCQQFADVTLDNVQS